MSFNEAHHICPCGALKQPSLAPPSLSLCLSLVLAGRPALRLLAPLVLAPRLGQQGVHLVGGGVLQVDLGRLGPLLLGAGVLFLLVKGPLAGTLVVGAPAILRDHSDEEKRCPTTNKSF